MTNRQRIQLALLGVALCGVIRLANAQTAPSPAPPAGSILAVIAPQGADAIKQVTGVAPKAALASLARVDVCNNDPGADHNVSTSRIISAVETQEHVPVYGSEVVRAVLIVLQQKDVYTRAQHVISAGGNTLVLLSALFKTLSPVYAGIVANAPNIASAVLPAVSDPRDIAGLASKIMQDGEALALGRAGSGNDCRTGLVVLMGQGVGIGSVVVQ